MRASKWKKKLIYNILYKPTHVFTFGNILFAFCPENSKMEKKKAENTHKTRKHQTKNIIFALANDLCLNIIYLVDSYYILLSAPCSQCWENFVQNLWETRKAPILHVKSCKRMLRSHPSAPYYSYY